MSNTKKPQEVFGPIEIKDIKKFQEEYTTLKKENLRVLLLDEENKILYIPISDIDGSSGSNQDLQQTLDNGNETDLSAIFKVTDTDYIKESKVSENGVSVSYNDILSSYSSLVELVNSGFFYSANDTSLLALTSGVIDSSENAGNIGIYTETSKGNIIVPNELSTGVSVTKLPVADGSPITLATEDQITLQKVIDNDSYAEVDGGNSYITLLQGADNNKTVEIYLSSGGSDYSYIELNNSVLELQNILGSNLAALQFNDGKTRLVQQGVSGLTALEFEEPIANIANGAIIKVPALPSGEYTLAIENGITLQKILDNGTNASFDGGDNTADILTTLSGTRKRVTFVTSTIGFGTSQFSVHDQLAIISNNTGSSLGGSFSVANGLSKIQQDNGSVGTTVQFNTPTSASVLNFPAPDIAGDYTIALKENLIPTINIIPDGNFIIPDGADTKMITLKDTDPQIVTLPTINNSIGSIYFITNDSTGTVNINSNTGGNDIWDSGTLVNTKPVISGTILRIINDGESFKIL